MKRPLFTIDDAVTAVFAIAACLAGAGTILLVAAVTGLFCLHFSC